jgi:hypothetical protein
MPAKIVQLGVSNLADIPAMLRNTADQIEAGTYGEVGTIFIVMPRDDGWPKLLGFGDVTGINEPIVQLELTKHWLLNNLVTR